MSRLPSYVIPEQQVLEETWYQGFAKGGCERPFGPLLVDVVWTNHCQHFQVPLCTFVEILHRKNYQLGLRV